MSTAISVTVCGAHYKTRPGLKYHIGHSHKDKDGNPVAFKDVARIANESQGTFGSPRSFSGFGGTNEGNNFGQGRSFSHHHCLLQILCSFISSTFFLICSFIRIILYQYMVGTKIYNYKSQYSQNFTQTSEV